MSDAERKRRLLIVSDMHLGRDCKEITGFQRHIKPSDKFDQAFVDMLDHYTSAREHEWRLVVAGDFVDFVEVVVAPNETGPLNLLFTFEVSDEERSYGLGSEAERGIVKLERTFEYHGALFKRLARFVKEGGELVILRGNHDAEFHWRKVQRVFRRRLADLAFSGQHLDVDQALELRTDFQTKISFAPWCYIEPGRIYIEHGHQYDVYCSFDHQLYPVSPTNPRRIDTPLFAFAMRFFVNMLSDFAAHNADFWTWREYYAWLRKMGFGGIFYTTRMAIGAGWRMLRYAGHFAYGRVRRYGKEHAKHLAEEAKAYRVPVEKLSQVDQLHHTPVNRNLSEMMRLLFLDRFLLVVAALSVILGWLIIADDPWIELAGVVITAIVAVQVNRRMAPRRFLVPGPKQAQAAKKIAELMNVPLVVMGHSHARRVTDLGGGRKYVNTGCWLPPIDGVDHVDAASPCSCKLSHLVVEDDFELRVFCRAAQTVRLADVAEVVPSIGEQEPDVMATADLLVP